MRRTRSFLACLLLGLILNVSHAQVAVGVEIPTDTTITLSEETLTFDLAAQGYPPESFPARYTAKEGEVEIKLFSNIAGGWALNVSLENGLVGPNNATIPVAQLATRVDGGSWQALAEKVTLLTSSGVGEETHTLELRLELLGNERPGTYQGVLSFSLTSL